MAGRMNSFAPLSRTRTRRGMNEQASSWLTAIDGLPAVHDRLKRVVVLNRRDVDVIRQQDGPATLFYCDPPYVAQSRTAPNVYRCEMTDDDHYQLLTALATIKGKFILSGYDCEQYQRFQHLYLWNRTEVQLPNNAAGGDAKRRMTEVLWSNF
jgi:DNA adenine methylase